jgi:hypothetical protein
LAVWFFGKSLGTVGKPIPMVSACTGSSFF